VRLEIRPDNAVWHILRLWKKRFNGLYHCHTLPFCTSRCMTKCA
jgi:hypothetical protein